MRHPLTRAKMNYYSFHIGDYAAHTRRLSLLEDLAYRRLLDEYYLQEQPLVGEPDLIARQIGMAEYVDEIDYVLTCFFEHTPDGYINKRADEEIAKYHSKQEQAVKAGRASAEKRLGIRSTAVQPTNNQEPITNNQYIKEFDLFWEAYGKKRGKPNALKEWKKLSLDEALIGKIIEMAKKQAIAIPEQKFRKDPERWLKYKCWEDELISQHPVSKQVDDKSWQFSNEGIVAKANELGLRSEGLSYQQLKDKCLYVMTNRALQ